MFFGHLRCSFNPSFYTRFFKARSFKALTSFTLILLIAAPQASFGSTPSAISIEELKSKTRMKSFTEWMSPSLSENGTYMPTPEGKKLSPSNSFSIVWADYPILRNMRVLFWQRYKVFFGEQGAPFLSTRFRNPRFALRWLDVIDHPNFSTTYDFYIQPGLAQEAKSLNRDLELGFRTVTQYSIPATRWRLGATTEFTWSTSLTPTSKGQNYYGWITTAIHYDLSPRLAAQSFVTINFKQNRGTPWFNLVYDAPLPYIQNGLGYQFSSSLSASFLLNNYLNHTPTLKNTWASLWLTLTWL